MSPKDVIQKLDVYVRVSRVGGRQGDSFISPKVQRERAEALIKAKGYKLGEVFTDLDESGAKMARPEFERALDRVRAGDSDGIVVAKLDRFARNTRGLLEAVEEIERHGGAFVCVEPTIDTADEAYGKFLLTLFSALAELELGRIRSAWAQAHASMIERGVHSGQPPVGYAKGPDKRLVVSGNADEIRAAFKMRAEGSNWGEVARFLTAEGVPTKSGRTSWTAGGARKLLGNRAYLGEARSGVHVNPKAHEALVTEETFRKANRSQGRGKRVERGDGPLLGGGLCRCGGCGSGLLKASTRNGTKRYEFLRCANTACKGGVTISLRIIEPYLIAKAFELLPKTAEAVKLLRAENPVADAEKALEDAEFEADEIERMHEAGELTPAAYGKALTAAQRAYEAALFQLTTASGGSLGYLTQSPERVRAALFTDEGEPRHIPKARQFLRDVLGPVIIAPGRAPVEERVALDADTPTPGRAPSALAERT